MRSLDQVLRTSVHILALIIALVPFIQGTAGASSLSATTLTSHSGSYLQFQQGSEINQVVQIRNGSNLQFFNADSLHVPFNPNVFNQSGVFIFPTNDAKNVHSILSASGNLELNDALNSQTTVGVNPQNADLLIRVHDWESVQIDEGTSKQFQISLRAKPSSDVEITISQFTTPDLSHNQSTPLTFTSSNYNTPQPVTVTAAQDANTVHESERITLTASGAEYDGMTKSFPVQVFDDDVSGPRIMMDPPNTLSLIDEGAYVDSLFQVWLSDEPDEDVTVTIAPFDNPDILIRSSSTLTFTPQNYSEEQKVNILMEIDDDNDDESAHTILMAKGGGYDGVTQPYRIAISDSDDGFNPDVEFENGDPRVTAVLMVKEGSSNSFELSLKALPPSNSTISFEWYTGKRDWGHYCNEPPASIVSFQPEDLIFTPFNYTTKQKVTVTALEDDNTVNEKLCLDLRNNGKRVPYDNHICPISIIILDKELGSKIIVDGPRSVNEGDSLTLKVKLQGQKPSGNVTVAISDFDNKDLKHTKPTLIFRPNNFNKPQDLLVTSIKDKTADDELGEITLKASGPNYNGVTEIVRVDIKDLDVDEIIAEDTIHVQLGVVNNEDFGIFLGSQPTGTVQVSISGHADSGLILSTESVEFTPNETTSTSDWNDPKVVELSAADDKDWKDDEILLTLTATGSDYKAFPKDVLIIIKQPDPAPTSISFELASSSAGEVKGIHDVALTIDPAPTTRFTANYSLSGSATENSDYSITKSGSVTIGVGETSVNIPVNIVNDNITETDETVIFTLTNQSAYTLGSITVHTLTITDNDDPPVETPTVTLSVVPTTVIEGSTTRVTATLSEAVSTATIIELEYEDIDTEPSDYTPLQRLTIAAGALTSSRDLRILDDEISEPNETFRVRLVKPEGVDLGTPSFVDVTIQDNDTPPPTEVILEVDRTRLNEGESVQVKVTLNDALDQAVTIPLDYPTDGASAVANLDYTPLPELTIVAGRTTQSGTIETLVDVFQEGDETFTVALGALPPEVVGGRVLSHTITIVDQRQPPEVSLSVDPNPVDEGEITTITVTLSGPLGHVRK